MSVVSGCQQADSWRNGSGQLVRWKFRLVYNKAIFIHANRSCGSKHQMPHSWLLWPFSTSDHARKVTTAYALVVYKGVCSCGLSILDGTEPPHPALIPFSHAMQRCSSMIRQCRSPYLHSSRRPNTEACNQLLPCFSTVQRNLFKKISCLVGRVLCSAGDRPCGAQAPVARLRRFLYAAEICRFHDYCYGPLHAM